MAKKPLLEDQNNYLLRVGEIATRYSEFENVIDETIWLLGGLSDRAGACITSQVIGLPTKSRIIVALMHEIDAGKDLLERAKKLFIDAAETTQFRNKYIHSSMHLAIEDGALVPLRRDRRVEERLKDGLVRYDKDEMDRTSERCQKLKNRAAELKHDLHSHLDRTR